MHINREIHQQFLIINFYHTYRSSNEVESHESRTPEAVDNRPQTQTFGGLLFNWFTSRELKLELEVALVQCKKKAKQNEAFDSHF